VTSLRAGRPEFGFRQEQGLFLFATGSGAHTDPYLMVAGGSCS